MQLTIKEIKEFVDYKFKDYVFDVNAIDSRIVNDEKELKDAQLSLVGELELWVASGKPALSHFLVGRSNEIKHVNPNLEV